MTQRLSHVLCAMIALTVSVGAGVARADDAEVQAGAAYFKKTCGLCHTAEAGKNKVGPSLFGVIGRKSGTAEGFNYSDAMKNANITWSAEMLEKYLPDPKALVPGNKMTFAGVKNPEDLKNVIAYLSTLH